MNFSLSRLRLLFLIGLCAGCANIVPPSGGAKDVTPPKLLSVTPEDSLLGVRTTKVTLQFDEYLTLTDAGTQVQISPLLPIPLEVTSLNKRVTVTIPDTLLQENTTYRITFGNAIRDLHEGNVYNGAGYIFSTGTYFDSLRVQGQVLNAATGLPDSTALVLLYSAAAGDSAIVRHRPMYVTHTGVFGNFEFEGLPARNFRVYALRDVNGNLTYDGDKEWIAFTEAILTPGSDTGGQLLLRTFPEAKAGADTAGGEEGGRKLDFRERGQAPGVAPKDAPAYVVQADTGDARRRTQELTEPLLITFSRRPGALNPAKLYLTFDSASVTVEAPIKVRFDTAMRQLRVETPWKEDALYTLRLQKGFASDSAGADLLPGRYTFRTKRDEDYAQLSIHLPSKYHGRGYVLQVANETDTIYQQPVLDTLVNLFRIPPGIYTLRVIEDRNRNGRWDTGDLFGRKQPELVIPYEQALRLKPGWEDRIDFEGTPPSGSPPGRLSTR